MKELLKEEKMLIEKYEKLNQKMKELKEKIYEELENVAERTKKKLSKKCQSIILFSDLGDEKKIVFISKNTLVLNLIIDENSKEENI